MHSILISVAASCRPERGSGPVVGHRRGDSRIGSVRISAPDSTGTCNRMPNLDWLGFCRASFYYHAVWQGFCRRLFLMLELLLLGAMLAGCQIGCVNGGRLLFCMRWPSEAMSGRSSQSRC